MTQATPRFLGATKKARATKPAIATATDAATPTQDQPMPAQHDASPKGKVSGKRTGAGERRGKQSVEGAAEVQPSGLALALRGYATRPDLYDAAVAHDPGAIHGAVDAMLRGAKTAGPAGIADRQALYRMLGLPWATASAGVNAKDLGAALGAAYGEAVSRLEGHRRHGTVTLDHADTTETADNRQS